MSSTKPASTADPEETGDEVTTEAATTAPPEADSAAVSPEVPATSSEAVPAADTAEAAAVDDGPQPRVVYVDVPRAPKKKGNRGIGVLFAVISALVYAAVFATLLVVLGRGAALTTPVFYMPIVAFVLGSLLLVLVLNRAGWWAHVAGSVFVGLFVYFGAVAGILLLSNVVLMTGDQAMSQFRAELMSLPIIIAALLAREVALWTGTAIAARGRSVKARNAEARAAFERESAERKEASTAANAKTVA